MNQSVKQLAIDAGFDIVKSEVDFNGKILRDSLERFARSIAKECIELSDADKIREKFITD